MKIKTPKGVFETKSSVLEEAIQEARRETGLEGKPYVVYIDGKRQEQLEGVK